MAPTEEELGGTVDLLQVFRDRANSKINPYYESRAERNKFAAEQILQTPVTRILNLGGGGERHLQRSFSPHPIQVFEIDIQGDCDLRADLDQLERLPFDDGSFDVVCAFDVLEHVENFHFLNDEMLRVARDYVLISLPNSAVDLFGNLIFNRRHDGPSDDSGTFSKYYGLPLRRPTDRHRWWMTFHDIVRFYDAFARSRQATLEFWTPTLNSKKKAFKAVFGSHLYYTFFCPFVWIKLGKPRAS